MSAPLRRLWWLHPAWPFAAIIATTIVVAFLQSDDAFRLYRTPKYVQFWHVAVAAGAIFAFVLGCRLGEATGRVPEPASTGGDRLIHRWFNIAVALSIFGYVAWLAVGVKNGFRLSMFRELFLTGEPSADGIRQSLFPTIPGVTTCTQFGVAALLLGLWLFFRGERRVIWPLGFLILIASARAVLFNERTALIEMIVPGVLLTLRLCMLGRAWPQWCRVGLRIAPVLGPVALLLFFGTFEYFRSWRYYQKEFQSYTEFTVWRLAGYYTTAHNNGAMALETGQPRPLPYYTIRSLWLFPGVRNSPFGYEQLTGMDVEENHLQMLKQHGNFELNNEGGLFQPTLDFGIAGSLLFWLAYGFVAGRLYRSFLVGTIAGVTFYPLIYLSILEVPLVLFVCYPRMFPAFATLAAVAWTTRRRESAEIHLQPRAGALAEAL